MKNLLITLLAVFIALVSGRSEAISVNVDAGGNNLGSGDTMNLSISASNNGVTAPADAYLILILPDSTPIFLEYGPNGLSAHVTTYDPSTWKKFLSNINLSGTYNTGWISVLNYVFSGNEPTGNYQAIFALTETGTFNIIDAKDKIFHVSSHPVAVLLGTYKGTWVNQTFGSSGSVLAEAVDTSPGIITITITLGGAVAGTTVTPPFTQVLTLDSHGGTFTGGSAEYGTINGTFTSDGEFQGTVTAIPGGTISSAVYSGNLSIGAIHLDFTVNFVGGFTATGVTNATKQ